MKRFRAIEEDRFEAITQIADHDMIEAVALDGPFRGALDDIGSYRVAEKVLTSGFQPLIGKPGQSNSPVGRKLNAATNACAQATLAVLGKRLQRATHTKALHELALAEAFPSAFLGVMLKSPVDIVAKRRDRSDRFFLHVSETGLLERLVDFLLPGRRSPSSLA